jgi:hypothetical protein
MDRIKKLFFIAGLLAFMVRAQADQTIYQPMIFSTGSSFTIQSGITATFASGSTVNFTGATVSGLSFEPPLGNPSTNGYVLSSTTTGTRSWIAPATGGGTPGGSNTQVQYNNAGALAGASGVTTNGTTLAATGAISGASLAVTGTVTVGAYQGIFRDSYGTAGISMNPIGDLDLWSNNGDVAKLATSGTFSLGAAGAMFAWPTGSIDTALARNAAGVVEINNGTAGTLRDLTLRNLTISGTCIGCGGGGGTITLSGDVTGSGTSSITTTNAFAKDGTFTLQNTTSTTKQARFDLSAITAGNTRSVQIPDQPTSTTVVNKSATTSQWFNSLSGGVFSTSQPSFGDIAGSASAAQMPAHTGDVTSPAGSTVNTLAAGNAGNLNSGTLLAARMPALTGDVTSTAGGVATTYNNAVPTTKGGLPTGGTVGQLLVKNTSTNYDASFKTPASAQTGLVSTVGTSSTTGVMAGVAASFTPATTGRALIICSGYMNVSAQGSVGVLNIRYGTGTAPAHGAAPTGTVLNSSQAIGTTSTASWGMPFSVQVVVTGLTVGTTYWLDVLYSVGAGTITGKLISTTMSVMEF